LRHTFASGQSDAGTETTSLSRLMGHTTNRTVERYVSNTFASHRQAVCTLQDHVRKVIAEGVAEGTAEGAKHEAAHGAE
jgi:integrase